MPIAVTAGPTLTGSAHAATCPSQLLNVPPTAATPNLSYPFGIAVDASGNIYVSDATTNTIHKFDSTGHQTMQIPASAATPNLSDPLGLALDSA
ncbi:MAG TPA: hypothetical protein VMU09_12315, partial [Acidimicrobiales bacterium]|nr:hypothetical protein [Acidimicrobiales bacterium]